MQDRADDEVQGPQAGAVGTSHASETERIGGTGGERTWRLGCNQADGWLARIYALGGPRTPLDMSLVREIGFVCSGFGATAYERWIPVVDGRFVVQNESVNQVGCPPGAAMYAIDVRAGICIDVIRTIRTVIFLIAGKLDFSRLNPHVVLPA